MLPLMHIAAAAMLLLVLVTAGWLLVLLGPGWASDQSLEER